MNSPELVFKRLSAALLAYHGPHSVALLRTDGGLSASAHVAWLNDITGTGSRAAVTGGKDVYEGAVGNTHTASWLGHDVLGDDIGAQVSTSSFLEGFKTFAGGTGSVLIATTVGDDHVSTDGWYTGGFIDAISMTLIHEGAGTLPIYAMAKSAGTMQSDPSAMVPDYQSESMFLLLDGMYNDIKPRDRVIFEYGETMLVFFVKTATVAEAKVEEINDKAVLVPATKLELENAEWIQALKDASKVRIWFDARRVGTLERIPTKTVTKDDFLNIPRPVTLPPNTTLPTQDTFIVIQDAEGTTLRAKGGGQGNSDNPQIMITELLEEFDGELVKPITFLWGLTKVTRGETINREIIGSGDATHRWQSFRLAKSPLTYVADPFAPGGRRPEIDVYVNGIKWRRAQSFYKATPQDEIYVLRHDAEHNTFVQFGDGELGKRLPTGANNVVATYRHGVGGNVEANTINKLVRPIKGVSSVFNPLPATGGEDPPTEAEAREKAIESTRVLGHLVSTVDFEVEAARYGGVVRAKALWGWDRPADDAVVKVWIICADEGDPSADLRTYLMNMAEPEVRVQVSKATPYTGELAIDLELDPNYLPEEVRAAVDARLFDEFEGLLAPRNVPIGSAFHRSELYAAIHEIAGVLSVRGALVDGQPMPSRILLEEGQYLALAYPQAG